MVLLAPVSGHPLNIGLSGHANNSSRASGPCEKANHRSSDQCGDLRNHLRVRSCPTSHILMNWVGPTTGKLPALHCTSRLVTLRRDVLTEICPWLLGRLRNTQPVTAVEPRPAHSHCTQTARTSSRQCRTHGWRAWSVPRHRQDLEVYKALPGSWHGWASVSVAVGGEVSGGFGYRWKFEGLTGVV